jgi:phage baseplate assembly protein W
MAQISRIFSDLDLNFLPHPATKDVTKVLDEQAIKASVRNLILTSNYERPFHPEIGSPIRSLLFGLATPMTSLLIERAIRQTIDNFEPRVNLTNVIVNLSPDNNSVYVTIEFTILNIATVQSISLILNRTR